MNKFDTLRLNHLAGILLVCMTNFLWSQVDTEVYLLDVSTENGRPQLTNPMNISHNAGYDNQPSFLDDGTILFSSTRNDQTDIARYTLNDQITTWITNTTVGSEYSPLKIPNEHAISAIRLDTNGLQRLYRYDLTSDKATELIKDLKIGYHIWYDDETIVCTVLVGNQMDLVVADVKKKTNNTVAKNVGRSLHKIPNTALVSYISKQDETWQIRSLDPKTGKSQEIQATVPQTEDMCWLSDGTMLMPDQQRILKSVPGQDQKWSPFHSFTEEAIKNISRMTVSPDGRHMAIVVDEVP